MVVKPIASGCGQSRSDNIGNSPTGAQCRCGPVTVTNGTTTTTPTGRGQQPPHIFPIIHIASHASDRSKQLAD